MRLCGILVIATAAALLGAPSVASAAGTTRASLTASPTTGTVETVGPPTAHRDDADRTDPAVDDGQPSLGLLAGLSGAATVALIGIASLVVGRRRSSGGDPMTLSEAPDSDSILERRTVRRAKDRLTEDPIVAAMGVDEQVAARRRRTTGTRPVDGRVDRPTRRR